MSPTKTAENVPAGSGKWQMEELVGIRFYINRHEYMFNAE
jgi:hypothetical protein